MLSDSAGPSIQPVGLPVAPDRAVGPLASRIEQVDIPAQPNRCRGALIPEQLAIRAELREVAQRVGRVAMPEHHPIAMQRVFGDQANVTHVSAYPVRQNALYRCQIAQRQGSGGVSAANWACELVSQMGMAVLGVDGDPVGGR